MPSCIVAHSGRLAWLFGNSRSTQFQQVRPSSSLVATLAAANWNYLRQIGPSSFFFRLAAILPPGRSWNENMRTWGDEWGDDISLFMSASGVEGMQIRVNIADLSVGFVDAICTLAQDFGWLFASESGEIIQPNRQAILKAVDKSPESKFVRNPAEFVARSSRRKKGPSRQSGRPKSGK